MEETLSAIARVRCRAPPPQDTSVHYFGITGVRNRTKRVENLPKSPFQAEISRPWDKRRITFIGLVEATARLERLYL